MYIGELWWGKLANPVRLVDDIINTLSLGKSVFVNIDKTIPWQDIMVESIIEKLAIFNYNRSYTKHIIEKNKNPGDFLINNFCSKEEISQYWPTTKKEEFLATSKFTTLSHSYVFVNLEKSSNSLEWITFIESYSALFDEDGEHGLFVVFTTDSNIKSTKNVECFKYSNYVSDYDCLMFCMTIMSSENYSSIQKQYISEVATQIAENNAKVAGLLAQCGINLIKNPVSVTAEVFLEVSKNTSNIEHFVDTALWNAQIKTVFPKIEQYRNYFIKKYQSTLKLYMSNSKYKANEVFELEIGEIYHICKENKIISGIDLETLSKFRDARNSLAHWNVIPYADMMKLLELKI